MPARTTAPAVRPLREFREVCGVDFSGAKAAGKTMWVARCTPRRRRGRVRLKLTSLERVDRLCGTVDREPAHRFLVDSIQSSEDAVWAIDFPFGLPVELFPRGWRSQLGRVRRWTEGAYAFGLDCLDRARRRGGPQHIRRQTDAEQRVPFDPYHYRIIYQTFFGMRDVAAPLWDDPQTSVLPFEGDGNAPRVVVEACPATSLHLMGLPHQNYKQAAGGPLTPKRRRTRRAVLDGLAPWVDVGDRHRRVVMRDPGADALDAVIAAAGLARGWDATDHAAVAAHRRYPREGRIYA